MFKTTYLSTLVLFILFSYKVNSQNVFNGEPVQIVGAFNGYATTPYASDYRTMSYRKLSTQTTNPTDGRGQWVTTINVDNSGGDISPIAMTGGANNGFLFISGPSQNRFQNKWAFTNVGSGVIGSNINILTAFNSGQDMGLNMSNTGYYTFVFNDAGYTSTNAKYWVTRTQNPPVSVSRVAQNIVSGQGQITIATSAAPSPSENVYVRYRKVNDFSSTGSNIVQAVGSGTNWIATIPQQNCGDTIYYYIFTSTRSLTNLLVFSDPSYRSMSAIRYDDNSGLNYSYTIDAPSAAIISGSATICPGQTTNLTVAITGGESPYTVVLSDGTNNFTINNYTSGSPIPVAPSVNTDYNIVSVTGANSCVGTVYSGMAEITMAGNTTFYQDSDGDGYGNVTVSTSACLIPQGFVVNSLDCNDNNPAVNPNATEICYDGLDNNCDGTIDEGCTPIVTVVQSTQCGTTLTTIDQYIYANLVAGAQGYRFKVTDMTTNQVQTIDKALRVFQLTQLGNYAFNRTYQIEVSVRYNNVWQPFYGLPCMVTTPATTTQVQATQCGSILTNMTDIIYANNVPFATGYRFRITNLTTSAQQVIDRPVRDVRMSTTSIAEFNATYSIEVAVKNTNGSYLPYGTACNITTPNFPTSQLQVTQCDVVLTTTNTTIYADSYTGASTYRFKFTSGAFVYTFDRPTRSFVLSSVPGLVSGTTYSVQVALEINGVFGPYGKVCSVTMPGASRVVTPIEDQFEVVVYPNPFTNNFKLHVSSTSETDIQIKVYDMLGKLIEDRLLVFSDSDVNEFGADYPSGIYNIIILQDDAVKTHRIVKR